MKAFLVIIIGLFIVPTFAGTEGGNGGGLPILSEEAKERINTWLNENGPLAVSPAKPLPLKLDELRKQDEVRKAFVSHLTDVRYKLKQLQAYELVPNLIKEIEISKLKEVSDALVDVSALQIVLFEEFSAETVKVELSSEDAKNLEELTFINIPGKDQVSDGVLLVSLKDFKRDFLDPMDAITLETAYGPKSIEPEAWRQALVAHEALSLAGYNESQYKRSAELPWFFSKTFYIENSKAANAECTRLKEDVDFIVKQSFTLSSDNKEARTSYGNLLKQAFLRADQLSVFSYASPWRYPTEISSVTCFAVMADAYDSYSGLVKKRMIEGLEPLTVWRLYYTRAYEYQEQEIRLLNNKKKLEPNSYNKLHLSQKIDSHRNWRDIYRNKQAQARPQTFSHFRYISLGQPYRPLTQIHQWILEGR